MKLKLLLFGVGLFLVGIILANVTCPSGNCPGQPATVFSGLVFVAGIIIIPVSLGWSYFDRKQGPRVPIPSDPMVYLDELSTRLESIGFFVMRNVEVPPYHLEVLARKSAVELSKGGQWTRLVGVCRVSNASVQFVQEYSKQLTKYGLGSLGPDLPRGFGGGMIVVPVLLSEDFDQTVKKWISNSFAPKHWAATEFPVLVSTRHQQSYYCTKTRIWGAAYYRGFRKFIESQIGSRNAQVNVR
jgi:hypothetical protein